MPRYIREGDERIAAAIARVRRTAVESNRPTGTERQRTAETAVQAALDSEFAKQLAEQLELELGPLPGQIQSALDEAAEALTEAGLARSEAADAVAAAQAAVSEAADAITAAQAAAQAAADAQTAADGKSTVVRSPSAATAAASYKQGDQWWQFDGADIVGLWLHDGTDWEPQALTDAIIATLDAAKITTGTLAADRIGALSITAAKIAAEAITTEKIAALAVVASHLAANSVTAFSIAADAVTAEKIAAGSVATDKLAALAVTAEKLAAGSVIAEKIAAEAITAEKIAAGAIDAMTIRSAQIFGGYIEAPVIASSDKLGSGTNVLNDPDFTSAVNTAWVASGHLGDANRTQTDTVNWSGTFTWQHQLYPAAYTAVQQNGSAIFDAVLSARPRKTGTLLFANHAWFNDAARTFSNPYSYPANPPWLSGGPGNPEVSLTSPGDTGAGETDITFMQLDSRAPLAGTARTTYLTNSAVVAVTSGERWNARLAFNKISAAQLELLSSMTVEVINSATNAVLWSRPLEADELQAGAVNAWWDSTFTGNVKMRVKAVYIAAAGLFMRRPRLTSYAYRYHNSAVYRLWQAAASDYAPYGRVVRVGQTVTDIYPGGTYAAEMSRRLTFEVTLSSALFAQVEPEAGWRLTPEDGLELFNSLGARTGKIDGESNYLAGVFATQESGRRLQIEGEELQWFTAAGVERSTISEDADGVHVAGQGLTLNGNPVWGVYAQAQSLGTTTITNMGTNLTAVPAPAALSLSRVIPREMRIRIELEVMLNVSALVAVGVALEGANVRIIVRDYMQHGIAYGGATLTAFCSHEMDVVAGPTTFRLVAGTWASSGIRIIEGAKIRILAAR